MGDHRVYVDCASHISRLRAVSGPCLPHTRDVAVASVSLRRSPGIGYYTAIFRCANQLLLLHIKGVASNRSSPEIVG